MEQSADKEQSGCYTGKFSKSSYSSHSDVSLDAREDKKDRKVFKPKKDQGYSHLERASSEEELVDGHLRSKLKKSGKVFSKLKTKKAAVSSDERSALQNKAPKRQHVKRGLKSKSVSDAISQLTTKNGQPVFGLPLKEALKNNPSHDGIPVPAFIRMCIDCVNDNGIQIEGIYRLSPTKSKVDELRQLIESRSSQNEVMVSLDDPLCAASLIKAFLRDLPDNLLAEFYSEFEQAVEKANTVENCQERVKDLATHLPRPNRTLLAYLFLHMRQIIDNAEYNKMPLPNVGLMLQPVLNFSQPLLSFLLQYPRVIFPDIKPKRYLPPIAANSLKLPMEFPNTVKDIEEELRKQESLLNFIHEDVKKWGIDTKKEEQLWDVQRLITQLKRELKKLKKHYQNSPLPLSDPGSRDSNQPDKATCLEMFEEKQLLAIQTELLEAIDSEEKMIASLTDQLRRLKADHTNNPEKACFVEKEPDDDVSEEEWLRLCQAEEQRREQLITQLIEERNLCAKLRAQIEMLQLEKHEGFSATRL